MHNVQTDMHKTGLCILILVRNVVHHFSIYIVFGYYERIECWLTENYLIIEFLYFSTIVYNYSLREINVQDSDTRLDY